MADDLQARREARKTLPLKRFRLGEEGGEDLSLHTTPQQRLAMVWELSQGAWELAGRPCPSYDRAHTPIRAVRRGQ